MEAQHGLIRIRRAGIGQFTFVDHDLRFGENIPIRGVIEMQVAQNQRINRIGWDSAFRQLSHYHRAFVVASRIKQDSLPTGCGDQVASAPAQVAALAAAREALEQNRDLCRVRTFTHMRAAPCPAFLAAGGYPRS